jgi:hypothetical protein
MMRMIAMGQPESRLSRRIMDELTKRGAFCFKHHGSEFSTAGIPDIIVCVEGKFFGLETKMPDKRSNSSTVQKFVAEKIRRAGGTAQVVCSVNEALEVCGLNP